MKELAAEYCAETAIDPATVLARWRAEYGDVNGALRRHEAVGCHSCRDGYKGRLGVYELLAGTQELKHLVRTRSAVPDLVRAAQSDGMRLLRQDALEKVLGGQLDLLSARAASS